MSALHARHNDHAQTRLRAVRDELAQAERDQRVAKANFWEHGTGREKLERLNRTLEKLRAAEQEAMSHVHRLRKSTEP